MIKKTIYAALLSFICVSYANAQKPTDSEILQSAINDELKRCMDSLKNDECQPVFMDFGLSHNRSFQVLSTLGGIVFSNDKSNIDFSSRLLMGSFHLDDENFTSKMANDDDESLALPQVMMPESPDYWPIRTVLWSSAERVFDSACKTYVEKLNVLAANNKIDENYPLDDFSKAPVVNYNDNSNDGVSIDVEKWKSLSKTISAEFKDYPEVINSIVYIGSYLCDYYFINSEGTNVRMPLRMNKIIISAVARQDDKSSAASAIGFIAMNENDLPSADSLLTATNRFAQKLIESLKLPTIEEEYNGPILYQDLAASEVFQQAMFRSSRFIARREEMSDDRNAFYLPEKPSANSFERKLDKLVVDKSLTVMSLSTMKKYKGVDLIGSFNIDAEGVRPPDTLVLVDNGKLKNLFTTRVPTFSFGQSNGHKRMYISSNRAAAELGPGVVMVKTNAGLSATELKKQLIAKAVEDDLDCAYIIRKNGTDCPFYALFKVDLITGAETPIRYFSLPTIELDDIKDDVLFGNKEIVYNTILGRHGFLSHTEGSGSDLNEGNGMPVSFITPNAVLIDKQKITISTERDTYKTPVVPSPLKK